MGPTPRWKRGKFSPHFFRISPIPLFQHSLRLNPRPGMQSFAGQVEFISPRLPGNDESKRLILRPSCVDLHCGPPPKNDMGGQSPSHAPHSRTGYILWNFIDIVDADGAGVTSVSVIVFPFGLSTNVFSRRTFPASSL